MRPDTAGFAEATQAKLSKILNPGNQSGIGGLMNKIGLGTVAALGAATAVSVKFGIDMQEVQTQIQGQMDTTAKKAGAITSAFLDMGGTFSGLQIGKAFAPVSGQLQLLMGHALSTKDAVQVMGAAMQLADATNHDLAGSTSALASVMFTFGIKTKGAADAAGILFNASRDTNTPIQTISNTVDRLHARLGNLAPSLKEAAGLMVMPGVAALGSRGVMQVSSALAHLLATSDETGAGLASLQTKAATSVTKAQAKLTAAQTAYSQKSAEIAAAGGAATVAQQNALVNAQQKVQTAQAAAVLAQTAYANATKGAGLATGGAAAEFASLNIHVYNAQHQYMGLRSIIGQLHTAEEGMTNQAKDQANATLFGAGAAQMMGKVVAGGLPAYDKAIDAVKKHGALTNAATAYQRSFKGQLETVKASLSDLATRVGSALLPKLEGLLKITMSLVKWFEHHKGAATALAAVIGGILAASVAHYVGSLVAGQVKGAAAFVKMSADAAKWAASTAVSIASTLAAWVAYAAEWLSTQVASMATFVAEHASMAASFIAENTAMIASATAAFIAENIATLGIVAGIAALAAGIVYLATHWKQTWNVIKSAALAAWHFLDNDVIHPIVHGISWVVDFIKSHWKDLAAILLGPFGLVLIGWMHFHKKITAGFMDLVHEFKRLGKDAIHAIVLGFLDGYHLVLDTAKKIGHGILSAFKDVWHIFSPSRDFHDMGHQMMQGLAQGISQHSDLANKALRTVKFEVPGLHAGAAGAAAGGSSNSLLITELRQLVTQISTLNMLTRQQLTEMRRGPSSRGPLPVKIVGVSAGGIGSTIESGIGDLAGAIGLR